MLTTHLLFDKTRAYSILLKYSLKINAAVRISHEVINNSESKTNWMIINGVSKRITDKASMFTCPRYSYPFAFAKLKASVQLIITKAKWAACNS